MADGSDTDHEGFQAVTISRSGSFELDMQPDGAFPLFTAPGEKLWIPSWDPLVLCGDGTEVGTMWVTHGHGQKTYWYVAVYDEQARHARYVRVTPDIDGGTVDVAVSSNGRGGSRVSVTYRLTGLSEHGNELVQSKLGEDAFAKMMEDWREMIDQSKSKIDAHFAR